jgi:hypothetical protein
MVFKLGTLLSVELIALICSTFMFIYVKSKKEAIEKWCTYVSIFFVGLVTLMMIFTLAVTVCMANFRHHNKDGERRMHKEMKCHERECDGECERSEENCRRGSMNCYEEGEECEEGKKDMDCCKEKHGWERNHKAEEESKSVKKDTVITKKPVKK